MIRRKNSKKNELSWLMIYFCVCGKGKRKEESEFRILNPESWIESFSLINKLGVCLVWALKYGKMANLAFSFYFYSHRSKTIFTHIMFLEFFWMKNFPIHWSMMIINISINMEKNNDDHCWNYHFGSLSMIKTWINFQKKNNRIFPVIRISVGKFTGTFFCWFGHNRKLLLLFFPFSSRFQQKTKRKQKSWNQKMTRRHDLWLYLVFV